jgi:plasmid stabilization system protein ParE
MTHEVAISADANRDMEQAISWLCRYVSAESAARWRNRVDKAIGSLQVRPNRCPEADEAASLGIDLRVLLSGKKPHVYRILFTFTDSTVEIVRVLHAARDWLQPDDL